MRARLLILAMIGISQLTLTSCSTGNTPARMANNMIYRQDIATSTGTNYPPRKAQTVAVYRHQSPNYPYRMIGVATVYKKNVFGKMREEDTIEDMMKKLAASIGGDGLVDFVRQKDIVQASVIVHQRALM